MKNAENLMVNFINQLDEVARVEKRDNPKDKPRVRQCINDTLDMLIRQLDFHLMREDISKFQKEDFESRLINHACILQHK